MEKNDLEIDNLPNRLTIFRILMIPVVVMLLFFADEAPESLTSWRPYFGHITCWVFVLASITDFLDGYIARKRNIVTVFGSFLDPIADKFLVVSSLIMLMSLDRVHPIVVIILVLREMYMTSLRLLAITEGFDVPVSSLGKWKTATQMAAIPMLMVFDVWLWIDWSLVGTILIYIAAFLSLLSALIYSASMIRKLREVRVERKKQARQLKKQQQST